MAKAKETPLMKQYYSIKAKYPGALLLFRVGDFYETFSEDAVKASKILSITLTKRANGSASFVELAGFPYHALDTYLPKLVRAGQRVAICDQLENAKDVKGIVKRGVTELVTPGVSFNDNVLDVKKNNYLASVYLTKKTCGVSFVDISTGEFLVAEGTLPYVDKLLQSLRPAEIIYSKAQGVQFEEAFGDEYNKYRLEDWVFQYDYAFETLTKHFKTTSLKGFGIGKMHEGIIAAGTVLHYLAETEHNELSHVAHLSRIEEEHYVWLDKFTIRNLELVFSQHESGVPLIDILDHTQTPMGGRLLRRWMVLPLKDKQAIDERLEVVSGLKADTDLMDELQQNMRLIGDLERLISKVAARRINPRELMQLKRALDYLIPIKETLAATDSKYLQSFADRINLCAVLRDRIDKELKTELPIVNNQGGMINTGVDDELDELHKIAFSGKDYLMQIQKREAERTGIPKVKIAYNRVFGYYLEVSNAHKDKVPEDWIRKQTLVNAERFITEELKVYEEKILNAEGQIHIIEQRLFNDLMMTAVEYVQQIQENSRLIAQIDCLNSFADVAITNKYCKPEISEDYAIDIKSGRHPVIEKQLKIGEKYIPNDVYLDNEEQQVMIITGPNMSGKSALLRQVALITLMAQIGCYVPAKSAVIGLVDKIFTRVGASDNLSQGESTFMVEMTETASILNNLSDRSLVLMDEIGRGTSTYDGISIAWSIVEHLHNSPSTRAKTLFATHYHELNELTNDFPRIKNFNVAVKEMGDKIVFMRKLKKGGSNHSFGIHVAQMAGMPNQVVLRAHDILQNLEKDKLSDKTRERLEEMPKANFQLSMFEANPAFEKINELLDAIDINTISPVEALLKLNEIKGVKDKG